VSVTQLEVRIGERTVATLSSSDGFEHHLTYRPAMPAEAFVSLVMGVRPESWSWPALHPFFQMNLPEGYLLSLLKERMGPLMGSRPLDLLAVVGANMIGRVSLHLPGESSPARGNPDLGALLAAPRSLDLFHELMREYASSGVSGVVPKFLSPQLQGTFRKASIATERYIVKGSSEALPFLALNEHLCMRAAARTGAEVAGTQVSDDGQVLLVHRFDVADDGRRLGFEDLCSLLGLTSDDKYNSNWDRVAARVRELVPTPHLHGSNEQLARTLLLTFALGNADCHTKNLGLLYSTEADVRVAPIYDMLSIRIYERYANNDPGMFIGGRKSWDPGRALGIYLRQQLGIEPTRQRQLIEQVCDALSDTLSELHHHAAHTPGFGDIAARMLYEWNEGSKRLGTRSAITVPDLVAASAGRGIHAKRTRAAARRRTGESPLLGRRGRKPPPS
jgi:serine/threonine-protein kinase HipA